MANRDAFSRRTATPRHVLPWLLELVSTLPDLVRSYIPGAPLDPRTRELIILAVSEAHGSRCCAWVHTSWSDFLGEALHDDLELALLSYARASAEAGRPLPTDDLAAVLPVPAIGALRATVAQIELANLVENTADGLIGRLRGREPFAPIAVGREVVTVAAAFPFAVPLLATAAAMRLVNRLAPPVPAVEVHQPSDANLLVHLLATAAPSYLAHALTRIALVRLPRPVVVGVRSGRTAATVRVGRGSVTIENGISRDTVLVVEGDVESLLQTATGSLVRELGSIRIRPT